MRVYERYLRRLVAAGLVVSEPFEPQHMSCPDGVMVAKPASVIGNGIREWSVGWFDTTTVDGPTLYLHTDGHKWFVREEGDGFEDMWDSGEQAVADILDYYFGDPGRMAQAAGARGLKEYPGATAWSAGSPFGSVYLEIRVPQEHPLRRLRVMADATLSELGGELKMIPGESGEPPLAAGRVVRALLLQALYTLRSEHLLEQLMYNLLFRWFVGLGVSDPVWDQATFNKNRSHLVEQPSARHLLTRIIQRARDSGLLSDERFRVDGALVATWATADANST